MEIRGPFAFPPCARLKKKREFEWVYQNGRQRYSKNFLVIALKSKTRMPRLGVTVARKVDKRAVVRNLIKRRIREVFRLNQHRLKEPLDIVVIARRQAEACSFAEVERQIMGALRHGGYLNS